MEKVKLEHKFEKLLVKGIIAVSLGSYEQQDLVGQLERLRGCKADTCCMWCCWRREWTAGVCWVGNWAVGDDELRPSIVNAVRDFEFKFPVLRYVTDIGSPVRWVARSLR